MNAKGIERKLESEGFVMAIGDIDLTYGQTWVRDNDYWFDVLEIVDLDSAAGAGGQILVTAQTTSFDYVNAKEHKAVQSSCDTRSYLPRIARNDKRLARIIYAQDIASYGISDPAGYGDSWFVAILDRSDFRDTREIWKHRVPGWGFAAIERAIDNALACFDNNGRYLPYDTED